MTTLIRTFAIMLALTGFSATTYTGTGAKGGPTANDGTGLGGAPICTNNLPNCGLD